MSISRIVGNLFLFLQYEFPLPKGVSWIVRYRGDYCIREINIQEIDVVSFHEPIYALCQAHMLYAILLRLKASQKFSVEPKMALCPTFSLYEIDHRALLIKTALYLFVVLFQNENFAGLA